MRQNFNSDPFKQDQHTLPISPQNFDPLDKPREHYPQKRPIFSSTPNKPKTLFEAMSEVENPPAKGVDSLGESDLKKMLSKEMSSQLEGIKNEILEGFTALLKGTLNPGKITIQDVQEMKRQMVYNKNKFEEVQDQIGHLNQQYNEVNNHYTQEIKSLRASTSFTQNDHSGFEEEIQSQIESQLHNFKQDVLSQLHNTLNSKSRSIRNDDVVNEMNQIKYSFEGELKQNFEMINGRVKKAEENLNELMRRKREYMDGIRAQTLASAENQNRTITQQINQVSNIAKSKYEQTQIRVAVNAEMNRRADSYRAEVDSLRKAIMLNQEDAEEMNTSFNRRLEGLDDNIKRQFFDLQTQSRTRDTSGQRQDVVERRIQKLNQDSEGYYNTIQQLRGQLDEVMKTHRLLQNQASTSSSKDIISRLEDKIFGLQNHIREIEAEVRRQQPQNQQLIKQAPKTNSPSAKLLRSRFNDNNEPAWQTPKAHRTDYRSLFETEVSATKERKFGSNQPQEEKMSLPDFGGSNSMRYNGDPKVRSIIDEFQQKQTPGFTRDKKRNLTERPLQFESLTDLNSFRDPRKSHYAPPSTSSKSYRDLQEAITSPSKHQKSIKYFDTEGEMNKVKSRTSDEIVQRPQILVKKASIELTNPKKVKHAKILSQINYFIYGTVSNTVEEDEDSEIYCNLDDDGYIFDEDGDFVLDSNGNKVKLTSEQIEKFNNNNMIE